MKDKVLILGGTEFVGRQLVEKLLLDASKEIYLFNRGKTNPTLFSNVNKIIGNRETDDIEKIKNHKWDYVVDFSSYYPASLKKTLAQINKDVKKYVYISTISVYPLFDYDRKTVIDEEYEKLKYAADDLSDSSPATYGKRKVACEVVLKEAEWLNKIVLRPSIIYGKYDHTDRFYFWVKKIKEQAKVLLPDNGAHKFSMTFADDLVEIILSGLKGKLANDTYNCSTHSSISIMDMMTVVKKVLNSKCEFINVGREELKTEGVTLPLSFGGNILIDSSKLERALAFKFKSFEESVSSVVNHCEQEEWKDCKVTIDEEVERKWIAEANEQER